MTASTSMPKQQKQTQKLTPMQQALLTSLTSGHHALYLTAAGRPQSETQAGFPQRTHDVDRRTFRALLARNYITESAASAASVASVEGKQYYSVTHAGRAALARSGVII